MKRLHQKRADSVVPSDMPPLSVPFTREVGMVKETSKGVTVAVKSRASITRTSHVAVS